MVVYDSLNNHPDTFALPRTKPLVAGDTVEVKFLANVTALPEGRYNLYLFVNADKDQPEQYLFNNALYKYIYVKRNKIVPVHLISFTGAQDGKGVMLDWKVTNEVDFSYYGVERSVDGRNFAELGQVPAGNSNLAFVKDYGYFDNNPADGKNYYRLKIVDKNGQISYTGTITVYFGDAPQVKVYPNPFTSQVTVTVKGNSGVSTVRVVDVAGKTLVSQTFTGSSIILDLSNLSAGNYLVQVDGGNGLKTYTIQKQAK
jgi:hypothetical protein